MSQKNKGANMLFHSLAHYFTAFNFFRYRYYLWQK